MQQFVLEKYLNIICTEDDQELEEVKELVRDDYIRLMLKIHRDNSSRKWRLMLMNAEMEKSDN